MAENTHWFSQFYNDNLFIIIITYFGILFIRFFINIKILNVENNTKKNPLDYTRYEHLFLIVMWWEKGEVKRENRFFAKLSNILGISWVIIFFGTIIGLVIAGVIK